MCFLQGHFRWPGAYFNLEELLKDRRIRIEDTWIGTVPPPFLCTMHAKDLYKMHQFDTTVNVSQQIVLTDAGHKRLPVSEELAGEFGEDSEED